MTSADWIGALLSEAPGLAARRADRAFDIAAGDRPLVLHGAGGLGRATLAALRADGIEPLCFADARAGVLGAAVDGLPVVPPSEAIRRHGATAAFVPTVFNPGVPTAPLVRELRAAGAQVVVPWVPLAWRHHARLLPYLMVDRPERLLAQADAIRAGYARLADEGSRLVYARQLALRLTGDPELAGPHDRTLDSYFAADVVRLGHDETLVDCGAYDGDTLTQFLLRCEGRFGGVVALEPDPVNRIALAKRVRALPEDVRRRIEVLPYATGARRETLRFRTGGDGAAIEPGGDLEVQSVALDELLGDRRVSFLKMDIEGAEPATLTGAAATITRDRPTLAVCAYHRPEHLWTLGEQLAELDAGHRFAMRRYEPDGWQVVLYGLPERRPTARRTGSGWRAGARATRRMPPAAPPVTA